MDEDQQKRDAALAALTATLDQMSAFVRDTILPQAVDMESYAKANGASPELAADLAGAYGRALMRLAKINELTHPDERTL